tara:strand:- start:501 stop:968 length:468 start_codon:yes stop_codon:yes gene_type:complete
MAKKDRKLDIKPSDYTLALKIDGERYYEGIWDGLDGDEKDGHRYFWFESPGYADDWTGDKLTIADNSGEYPHLTDDGLLFVDVWSDRDIVAGGDHRQASVPLIDLEGNRSSAPVNIFEAFSVARLLGLGITILDPGSDKEIAVSAASLYWDNGKI